MSEQVLIAYGSKHGSTAATAEVIAGMLRDRGLDVTVMDAAAVATLDGYTTVVIGGSVYTGRWHPDAKGFVKRFASELHQMPVAIFAMGPKTSAPEELAQTREQLNVSMRKVPDIGARPIAVFGGVIDPDKLHFPFNRLPASDARDWDAIRAFADQVAERRAAEVPSGELHTAGIG